MFYLVNSSSSLPRVKYVLVPSVSSDYDASSSIWLSGLYPNTTTVSIQCNSEDRSHACLSVLGCPLHFLVDPNNFYVIEQMIMFSSSSLLPSIISSRTDRICLLSQCPVHLIFLFYIDSNIFLFSPTLCSISSFVTLSVYLIFSISLHIHISNTSNL